ncbi:MAG: 4Fe-4S binding protein [Oscillospiraceae bacterium]|nr:4Fe-4S binding protein [Oscillospiraceae bacterium]
MSFTKSDLIGFAVEFTETSPFNCVSAELAISTSLVGLRLFDAPILGFTQAEDSLFQDFQRPHIVGEHFLPPRSWLPGAKSVLSFFLPFSDSVKTANLADPIWPAPEWLHGRMEGQVMVRGLSLFLKDTLEQAGYPTVIPSLDARFWSKEAACFTSNWSERHVAYACGLGTFGLSAGLITPKGMAGRFGSIVTSLPLPPDPRPYQSYHEYCIACGACVRKCPVHAISLQTGKNHALCSSFLEKTKVKFAPRYGCGKCQVAVPCESCIPRWKNRGKSSL